MTGVAGQGVCRTGFPKILWEFREKLLILLLQVKNIFFKISCFSKFLNAVYCSHPRQT